MIDWAYLEEVGRRIESGEEISMFELWSLLEARRSELGDDEVRRRALAAHIAPKAVQ
jgi:hypothetical protein